MNLLPSFKQKSLVADDELKGFDSVSSIATILQNSRLLSLTSQFDFNLTLGTENMDVRWQMIVKVNDNSEAIFPQNSWH